MVRRAERKRLRMPVQVTPGGTQAITGDISLSGVFVLTAQLRTPGSRVRLTFPTTGGPVHAEGVVRWVRTAPGFDNGPTPVGMGIEFVEAEDQARAGVLSASRRPTEIGGDEALDGQRRTDRDGIRRAVQVEPGGNYAVTRDLSARGAFVLTARPRDPGTRIRLTFRTRQQEICAEGHVRWVRPAADSDIRIAPMGMGIEFAKREEMLELYL
jgi:hypothetical protein